jgi:hypothetical protein
VNTLLAQLIQSLPGPAADPTHAQQVADAAAALAALLAMLVVIYFVIRVTYLTLKLFTHSALLLTVVLILTFTAIGVLNR